ncbi:YceI family protein [Shewanella woodyi]|uniref:YceI family protein n=1 Tax=Shewanella woodyi (strain ATCC 51908 / MS32) TaxID=392500 RepID=B1KRD8_SHEWM|nr:YceI family protein [Shewanella woodyi]ACA86345.1 YceI family protein [Shewanella woodyi ATCC 51908]
MKRTLIALALGTVSFMTSAAPWTIDNQSSEINFITTKKVNVSEVHEFKQFSGSLNEKGEFSLSVELASVWTNIEIRDARMREILFEVEAFPKLELQAKVSPGVLAKMAVGSRSEMQLNAELSFHGKEQTVPMRVSVVKLSEKEVLVLSSQPVIINAEQFGLSSGVEKLREIAGLTSIGHSVPVSFILNLTR